MPDLIEVLLLVMLGAAAGFIMETRLRQAVYRRGREHSLRRRSVRWVGPTSAVLTPLLWTSLAEHSPVAVVVTVVVVVWVLLYLVAVQLDIHRLPYQILLPTWATLGLALLACSRISEAPSSLARAGLAGAIGFVVAFALMLADPTGRVGLDDAVLAGLVATLLGWFSWALVRNAGLGTLVLGAVVAAAFLLLRRLGHRHRTFLVGPVLVASTVATLLDAWRGLLDLI